MDIFILGSCVSRDIFRVIGKDTVVDYYARTTFKSLISKPVSIDQINLKSEFQKKIVRRDFEKTLFDDLRKASFDHLIIDLIDERFDVLKVDYSYVTKSAEFVNAGLSNIGSKIDKSLDDWKKDCRTLAGRLLEIVPLEKIIIHEAYWANQYQDDGELKDYPNQKYIDASNKLLGDYYAILKQYIPAKVIFNSHRTGDAKHVWGLTPFHYTDDYYRDIYAQIQQISAQAGHT